MMGRSLFGSFVCRALSPGRQSCCCMYEEGKVCKIIAEGGPKVHMDNLHLPWSSMRPERCRRFYLHGGISEAHSELSGLQSVDFSQDTEKLVWPGTLLMKNQLSFCQRRCASSGGSRTARSKRVQQKKKRLDEVCVERYPQYSRTLIQSWILQGKVLVDGQPADKAGTAVSEEQDILIIAEIPKYVCRAGYKLEAALEHFVAEVKGRVVLDAGLSTGGFTDCLLQNGAFRVYGVDVGYGQVAEKIRTHERVIVMERTNLRYLSGLPQHVDLVTLDLSFISILLVLPAVLAVMKPDSSLITLIKPQFEARRNQVGGGGIVRDEAVHQEVLNRIIQGVEALGLKCEGWITSPMKGADGNVEFLACFHRGKGGIITSESVNCQDPTVHQDLTS